MKPLREYYDEWLKYLKLNGRSPRTNEKYTKHLDDCIDNVSQCNVDDLLDFMQQAHEAYTEYNYEYLILTLKKLANFALNDCDPDDLPFFNTINKKIKAPPTKEKDIIIPTDAEVRQLLDTTESNPSMQHKTCVSLMAKMGLRQGEVLILKWTDVDFDRGVMNVGIKQGRRRTLPFNHDPELLDTLLRRRAWYFEAVKSPRRIHNDNPDEFYVINDHGFCLAPSENCIMHLMVKVDVYSGVRHYNTHAFRHYYACSLSRRGVGVEWIQKALGHSSLVMTQQYLRGLNADIDSFRSALSIGFPLGGIEYRPSYIPDKQPVENVEEPVRQLLIPRPK